MAGQLGKLGLVDLKACPGRRILIMGNQDVGQSDELEQARFTERHWALLLATPLRRPRLRTRRSSDDLSRPSTSTGTCTVPKTARSRHANVSVERTDYRPVRLSDVLRQLKAPLGAERENDPG